MIKFKQKHLTEDEIFTYLTENKDIFIPELETRLNVREYALKLHLFATHFGAFDGKKLVGLVACYFNDQINKIGFITSVSVSKDYQGLQIMTNLLTQVILFARKNNFAKLKLEVRPENKSIIVIYKKFGFSEAPTYNSCIEMEMELNKR